MRKRCNVTIRRLARASRTRHLATGGVGTLEGTPARDIFVCAIKAGKYGLTAAAEAPRIGD
jgi:hypothetical protein